MQILIGNAQDIGARDRQEDYLVSNNENSDVSVAVLADGMGGYEGGDQASQAVAVSFRDYVEQRWDQYLNNNNTIPDLLIDGVYHANSTLAGLKEGTESNMGSTLVALVIQGQHAWWVSVGDSLIYLFRDGELQKLNAEHSHYQDLRQKVFLGEISRDQAINDPERDGLTSALMGREMKYVDVSRFGIDLQTNDCFLLASDGLETISEDQTATILRKGGEPQQVSDGLVEEVVRVRSPHQDNVSVLVIKAIGGTKFSTKTSNKNNKRWLAPLAMLIFGGLLGITSSLFINKAEQKQSTLTVTPPQKENKESQSEHKHIEQTVLVASKPKVDCAHEKKRTLQACIEKADSLPANIKLKQYCTDIAQSVFEQCNDFNVTGIPPTRTGIPPAGTGIPPAGTGIPPAGTGIPPAGTGIPPAGTGIPPAGTGAPPAGTSPIKKPPPESFLGEYNNAELGESWEWFGWFKNKKDTLK